MPKRFQLPVFSVGDTVKTPGRRGTITRLAYDQGKTWYLVGKRYYAAPELSLISKAKPPKKAKKRDNLPF